MRVRFLKPAEQELSDAVSWYIQQVEGLGRDFLDDLDRGIRRIAAFPPDQLSGFVPLPDLRSCR
jgi:hypothetical protein